MQITYMVSQKSQCLLYSGFKWLSQKEVNKLLLNLIGYNFIEENSSDGYILEVDLNHPDELRELHNNYPLIPILQINIASKLAVLIN